MRLLLVIATCSIACGGSALQNIPQANPAVVAGVAAGLAGAATLADPNGANRRTTEANKPPPDLRPQKPGPSVPADVLDRLDKVKRD